MNYEQNTLSLACQTTDGSFLDASTGAEPVIWRGQALRIRLGAFNGAALADLSGYASITASFQLLPTSATTAAYQTQTIITAQPTVADWLAGNAQHAVFDFTAAMMDVSLSAQTTLPYWLTIQGLTSSGHYVTLAAAYVNITTAGQVFPLPPYGYVSQNAQANSSGDSTVSPNSFSHVEAITFSGVAGTRRVALSTAGMNAGATALINFVFPATSGIIIEVHNGSVIGTLLKSYTTDGTNLALSCEFYFTGSTWSYIAPDQTIPTPSVGLTNPVSTVDFNTSATFTNAVARAGYDNDSGTVLLGLRGGNIQARQAQDTFVRIANTTGSALTVGQVVYVTGSNGARPLVALASTAISNLSSTEYLIVAEPIASAAEGYALAQGMARAVNTSSWSAGDALWLSATAGVLTNSQPTSKAVYIGRVITVSSSAGLILVQPNVAPALTATGVTAGAYSQVAVNSSGLVTAGANPTTLAGYGITDAQAKNADLTAVAALSGTGFAKRTGVNTWALDTSTYLTGNQTITFTGDATGSGATAVALTLPASGATAGTFAGLTVNAKGLVTASASISTLAGYGITDAQAKNADLTAIAALSGTGFAKRTGAGAWALDTNTYLTGNQAITITGDATGSGTTALSLALAASGVTAGTYKSVTVDAKGRVTTGSNPTTLAGYGIVDAQPLSAELTGVSALAAVGHVKRTGTGTYSIDPATYLTANQTVTLSGDVTGSGATAITATLAASGVTAGTYKSITVDAKGRATAGTNPTTLSGFGITDGQPLNAELTGLAAVTGTGFVTRTGTGAYATNSISVTGDATGSGTSAIALTLAASGATAGSYGGNTASPLVTVDAKGRVTAISAFPTIVASIAALKGLSVSAFVTGNAVNVLGYYAAGDGGGGTFYYSSTSSATDNGGTIIAPTSGSGRWLRVYDGAISVLWFGARGDGVNDSTTAIQAAINFVGAAGGGTVALPAGTFLTSATLAVSKNGTILRGESMWTTTIIRNADFGDTLKLTGNDSTGVYLQDCGVYNLKLTNGNLMTSGVHLSMNGTFHCDVEGVYILQGFIAMQLSGVTAGTIRNTLIQMDNLYGGSSTNRSFCIVNSSASTYPHPTCGDLFISDFNWRNGAATIAQYGILITGGDGVWFSNGHCGGASIASVVFSNSATGMGQLFFDNIMFDAAVQSYNILFQGSSSRGRFIQFSNCDIEGNYQCNIGVIFAAGCSYSDVTFTGCRIFGHRSDGVQLLSDATYKLSFTGCNVENNNSDNSSGTHGYRVVSGVKSFSIVGGSAGGTDGTACYQRYGISIGSGAGDDILIDGVDTRYNQTGGIDAAPAGDNVHIVNCYDGSAATVASASAILLPYGNELVTVTGTTTINNLTAAGRGQRVTLLFASASCVVSDAAGNVQLAGAFVSTANATLSLICDGTTWYETGRSVN